MSIPLLTVVEKKFMQFYMFSFDLIDSYILTMVFDS